jgi:sporulation-control protein spo0M
VCKSSYPSCLLLQEIRSPTAQNDFEIPFLTTPRTTPPTGGKFEEDVAQDLDCLQKKARRKHKVLDVRTEMESPVIKNSLKNSHQGLREADYMKQVCCPC